MSRARTARPVLPATASASLRFDFVDADGRPAPLTFTEPVRVIVARAVEEVPGAMAAVEAGLAAGLYAAGFVSYEAAPAFDAALKTRCPGDLPLVWFGLFDAPRVAGSPAGNAGADAVASLAWAPDTTAEQHAAGVAAVRDAIASGDTYQGNLTFRLRAPLAARDLRAAYHRLAADQRAPYSAWLDLGRWQILSLSPELFFRLHEGRLVTRPMKGTAARGVSPDDDERMRTWLRTSDKNRAENVMIVDLARNDLSRVSDVGTVRATSLFEVERYPSVFQLVSTVEGRVRQGVTLTAIFRALFPAGSITGAPKTSSMRVIAALESSARGAYCGAIGFATPGGEATFNVAIRTMTADLDRGTAEFGTGGGITWDSRAADEYAEALAKTACLTPLPPFDLFETMRLDHGRWVRVEAHLDRLARSAGYFDRAFSIAAAHAVLDAHARAHPGDVRRGRLRVDAAGVMDVHSEPFSAGPAADSLVAVADTPIRRGDRWLRHKTTRREVYDRHRLAHPAAFDVLLWNEDDELTEFTIGNLVLEIDDACWTPPLTSGLLPGVFRAALLAAGTIGERVLRRSDLARARRAWLINSLREWVAVRVAPPAEVAADSRQPQRPASDSR